MNRIKKIVLFGAPGSGKGTQAVQLGSYLQLRKISLGDILRQEVKGETELGREVKGYMDQGVLVPDDLASRVIEENVGFQGRGEGEESREAGFILDGYPRNLDQAKKLEEILQRNNDDIDAFIYLDMDQQTILERLSKRKVCKACGANYHLENMPPKKENVCDACGNNLTQRKDDDLEVIKKRWKVFLDESQKILDFYQSRNKLVRIDGRGSKDEIFQKIKEKLQ